MFSASIGRDGRRRWSGLLAVDAFVVILAALDLGVGVWQEIQHGKPAGGAALTGIFGGTSATVYFGTLCLCWDEGPSPRLLLLGLASFIVLVGSALLGAHLQCMEAPRENRSPTLLLHSLTAFLSLAVISRTVWRVGMVASCSFLAFLALRVCGGRAFELAGAASAPAPAPAPAPIVAGRLSHPMRQQVVAEIRRLYQKAAPDKVQQASGLIDRYPPEQWHQMLRLIQHKYGQTIEPTVLAKTAAICPARGANAQAVQASKRQPQSSNHNRIGRALALLLPVFAFLLFDGELDPTDRALNHGLRAVSFLTGPHFGSTSVMLPRATAAQLRWLYPQLLPTPTAISRPSEELIEVSIPKDDVGTPDRYPIRVRLLTPTAESAASRRMFQKVDSNADGTIHPAELDAWRGGLGNISGTDVSAGENGGQRPLLIWFSWSTLVLGGAVMDDGNGLAEALADSLDVLVAVVDVGLAPEQGYPHSTQAGLEAVDWLLHQVQGGQIGVDKNRIMIGGAGGGGTVAASIALSDKAGKRLRKYTNTRLAGVGDNRVFESCLLITPMLKCPNKTTAAYHSAAARTASSRLSSQQRRDSRSQAERMGATVMSGSQVDWSWDMYGQGHPGGVNGCASSVDCSPSSATEEELKGAGFEHLVILTASKDALFDEGAHAYQESYARFFSPAAKFVSSCAHRRDVCRAPNCGDGARL